MALTTTTALSYYQLESSTISEWTNPITFSLDALSADDIEVFVINTSASEGSQKLALIEGVDYTLDFAAKTVTCTSSAWSGLSKITGHSANQIRVHRATTSTALVDFTNGAVLNDTDLNLAYKQNLFAAQEMNEDAALTRGGIQSVSEGSLAALSVSNAKIQNSAVDSNKLATDAVVTAKIQNTAVNADKLATDAVTTAKIQNSAVDVNKLASNAVTTVKIQDDAVTYAKVAPASKAEMEGQSAAGVVTPDVLKNSPLVPKCYGVVSYDDSTPSLSSGSFNVASVSEPSADKRTVTFATALNDANYVVVATMQTAASVGADEIVSITAKTDASFTLESTHNDNDDLSIHFVVFGSTYAS